ncbi:histone-lysine N-methyltransferase ATXR2 [Apium graveolens]|uniref:histone-lysine N-methyltransferase ATXR2 n=1 Tax=Apium graveolens TaxID=4045 RepID=UPI003D7A9800
MESICPIDTKYAQQIADFLTPPSAQQVEEYFEQLIASRKCLGIKVKPNSEYGKGVYADLDFEEGDLILKDQMLFGVQHFANKIDCFVCSFCYRFISSIEHQIGRKLYLQNLGVSTNHECDEGTTSVAKAGNGSDSSDDAANSDIADCQNLGECGSSSSVKIPLPMEVVHSLMHEELVLPYSTTFPQPLVVPCRGGCSEGSYCSKLCMEADWDMFHSLLCTGTESKSRHKEAMVAFIEHANETNDIFLLAAKAIVSTILKYRKLKAAKLKENGKRACSEFSDNCDYHMLLEAWKPISMGYKRSWWDCMALPDDVDSCDEAAFRMQIRQLAFTSLELLKEAIFDKECELLFSLEIYGNLIGMFELNNLDLVVASPVEDYFLYVNELPESEKKKAEQVTKPFLNALGDDYSVCCQGTAFFPLQSCMNHSCLPNAKAFKREQDRDGQATIIALRPIHKGEEITISYIDEDLPLEERQASLADYGFSCRCPKCSEEQQ